MGRHQQRGRREAADFQHRQVITLHSPQETDTTTPKDYSRYHIGGEMGRDRDGTTILSTRWHLPEQQDTCVWDNRQHSRHCCLRLLLLSNASICNWGVGVRRTHRVPLEGPIIPLTYFYFWLTSRCSEYQPQIRTEFKLSVPCGLVVGTLNGNVHIRNTYNICIKVKHCVSGTKQR